MGGLVVQSRRACMPSCLPHLPKLPVAHTIPCCWTLGGGTKGSWACMIVIDVTASVCSPYIITESYERLL